MSIRKRRQSPVPVFLNLSKKSGFATPDAPFFYFAYPKPRNIFKRFGRGQTTFIKAATTLMESSNDIFIHQQHGYLPGCKILAGHSRTYTERLGKSE